MVMVIMLVDYWGVGATLQCKETAQCTLRTPYERMVSDWEMWIGVGISGRGDCPASFLPVLIIFCLPLIIQRPGVPPVMKSLNHTVYI